ncbi:uncharacterized protein BJ171DRAFT_195765 [Polychytrium aggregatum]|uniref:uncharacterized protein n=1 Tax=Polychytrium aggregatum TaxID=110093 RepID=UPI0022FE6EDA|nr:uncharacterized protein BJ171DRAFT_195765 [Polychytrium aggregatum]KAI9201800.1 hypothetical protein BJ171DRAFT_195765 [Polychytrium aggregatum]
MNAAKESDWVEEESVSYAVLDFGADLHPVALRRVMEDYNGMSVVGIDTATPYVRLGNMTFQGVLDQAIGTDLLFEQQTDTHGNATHKYVGNTSKKIRFQRVELIDKTGSTKKSNDAPNASSS